MSVMKCKWNEWNEMEWNETNEWRKWIEMRMTWNEWNALNDWSEWNECTDGRNDWFNKCMHACMHAWMNEWIIESMRWLRWLEMKWNFKRNEIEMIWNENEHDMNESVKWQLDLPTLVWDRQFSIFTWNRALATVSRAPFANLIFPKNVRSCFFFCGFGVTSWSFDSPVLCQQLLPIEVRTRGSRDPPSATTEATLPEKNTGLRARESFQAWVHAFPTCYTSQNLMLMMMMMVMMMMMMKLVWWWWWFWWWWDWWWWWWWWWLWW